MLIAIGNADDASLATEAERLLDDASPLVRGAAVWALSQLIEPERFEALAANATGIEADEDVRAEWRQISALILRRRGGVRRNTSDQGRYVTALTGIVRLRGR